MNKLLFTIAAIITLSLFSACGGDDNNEVVVLTSIAIDPVDKDLYIGDTYQLTISHQPTDVKLPKLTWTSSDTKVATVSSSGKVTAVADGVVTITAKYGDLSNSLIIATLKKQNYTSIRIYSNGLLLTNCRVAILKNNIFKEIKYIDKLIMDTLSEEIILDNSINEIYIFGAYGPRDIIRTKEEIRIQVNKLNIIHLEPNGDLYILVDDTNDPTQYPV